MTDPPGGDPAATLHLADWRRQVADLYAAVRRLIPTDHAAAVELWRTTRERLYREHPQSPVPAEKRAAFRAHHYPIDSSLRFEVAVTGDAAVSPITAGGLVAPAIDFGAPAGADPTSTEVPVSAGGTMSMRRIGHVEVPLPGGARRLGVFWMGGYAGGLFIPFRDATNGTETYAAGRYLVDSAKSADLGGTIDRGTVNLDFNFAFHPSCAFDSKWACPLAPPDNRLDLPIRAGERLE